MKRSLIFYLLVSLVCWTACGDDSSIDPKQEPEIPVFPNLSKIKIDKVYRDGELYLQFTYRDDLLLEKMEYFSDNQVRDRTLFEYDGDSRLVSFTRRYLSGCCQDSDFEVEYEGDHFVRIKEYWLGQPGYHVESYQFDQEQLISVTENLYDEEGTEYLQKQNRYLYQNGTIYQVIYHRNYGVRTYDAQFDDKVNPFYGIPTSLIGAVFPGIDYVPNNLLSLEGEYGTAILNEFTYDEDGYPIAVDVTTDNLDMVITYIE